MMNTIWKLGEFKQRDNQMITRLAQIFFAKCLEKDEEIISELRHFEIMAKSFNVQSKCTKE